MHRIAVLGLIGALLSGIAAGSAGAAEREPPAIAVRIVDYAQLPTEAIAQAQRLVSEVYGFVGIGTRWGETVRPNDDTCEGEAVAPGELFVIILPEDMTRRRLFESHVIGTAAVSVTRGGRVAYVLFDRVWQVASDANSDVMDVMGLVIAHELGHLLMPAGPHSQEGLMRANWTLGDLREGREQFQFTRTQADTIRHAVAARLP